MSRAIIIKVFSTQQDLLLTTTKTRYNSESDIIHTLAAKALQDQVISLSITKPDGSICLTYVVQASTADAARTLIYGEDLAVE